MRRHRSEYLSAEKEVELSRRYHAGDRRALSEFVEGSQELVGWVWKKHFRNYRVSRLDLLQEGNIGLLRAIDLWRPEREIRFMTYASHWIRAFMGRYILSNATGDITIPDGGPPAKVFWRLRRMRRELGDDATPAQLAESIGVAPHVVEYVWPRMQHLRSLQQTVRRLSERGNRPVTLADVIPDEAEGPDELAAEHQEQQFQRATARRFLKQLEPRQRFIIEEHMLGERCLADVGRLLGISRQRAAVLKEKAIATMQSWSKKVRKEPPR